jgi:hypothetical protein
VEGAEGMEGVEGLIADESRGVVGVDVHRALHSPSEGASSSSSSSSSSSGSSSSGNGSGAAGSGSGSGSSGSGCPLRVRLPFKCTVESTDPTPAPSTSSSSSSYTSTSCPSGVALTAGAGPFGLLHLGRDLHAGWVPGLALAVANAGQVEGAGKGLLGAAVPVCLRAWPPTKQVRLMTDVTNGW